VDLNSESKKVVKALHDSSGVVWVERRKAMGAPPPPEVTSEPAHLRSLPPPIAGGGVGGLTGKGVIIAILDTGLDFHHRDFIRPDDKGRPTSRLLYYWDTTSDAYAHHIGSKAPVNYPNGAPIGTLFSREDLTADLRPADPKIRSWDVDGHGTACAGLAAGNGSASEGKYAGVAPDADLIGVRLDR
jgi:subtilisin family serine protease